MNETKKRKSYGYYMSLLQTSASIILVILVIHILMHNVINLPFKDIISAPGKRDIGSEETPARLTKKDLEKIEEDNESTSLGTIEMRLREQYGVNDASAAATNAAAAVSANRSISGGLSDKITNRLPESLIEQSVYNPNANANAITASNHNMYEKEAAFGNEQTNVAQFFSANPSAFFNGQRHNSYVPDVNNWNHQGSQMFEKLRTQAPGAINAYNYNHGTSIAPAKL